MIKEIEGTLWATIECPSSSSGAVSLLQLNSVHSSDTEILNTAVLLTDDYKKNIIGGCFMRMQQKTSTNVTSFFMNDSVYINLNDLQHFLHLHKGTAQIP